MNTTLLTLICSLGLLASGCAGSNFNRTTVSAVESGIIGRWSYAAFGTGDSPEYEFSADHTYKYSQLSPKMSWSGRYEVESPNLLVLTGGPQHDKVMQIVFRGDTLDTFSGDGVLMHLKKIAE